MLQTDNNEAFLFVTPRSRSFDCIASRTAHFASFLTFFDRSPYLVLLGGRLTVLGHSLEKYKSSAILSAILFSVKKRACKLLKKTPLNRKLITVLLALAPRGFYCCLEFHKNLEAIRANFSGPLFNLSFLILTLIVNMTGFWVSYGSMAVVLFSTNFNVLVFDWSAVYFVHAISC